MLRSPGRRYPRPLVEPHQPTCLSRYAPPLLANSPSYWKLGQLVATVAENSGRCSFLLESTRPAHRHMTHFRVRRTAAEVGTRLRGCYWLVVSGRELAGHVLSFCGRGGAELTRTGASTADQQLGQRTLHGWSGAWTESARPRSLPRLGRGAVQTSLRSPLSGLGRRVPAKDSAPGPPSGA